MTVDWTAIWLSARLSLATMLTLVVVGVPVAYWVAFSRWRWKFLVEAIVALPLVLRARRDFDSPVGPGFWDRDR